MGSIINGLSLKRVLIVDDDASIEILWRMLLKAMGFEISIDWATSEVEATSMINAIVARGSFYDLVVTDIFLSGSGTGLDLWKKASPAQRQRFVIISAADQNKIEEHLKDQYSLPNFLRKPLDLDASMKIVTDIFELETIEKNQPLPSASRPSEI